MRAGVFSAKKYDQTFLNAASASSKITFEYQESKLNKTTAEFAKQYDVIVCFVNDKLNADVLSILAQGKTKLIALRCAGFNNVDLAKAKELGIQVARVPAYSPYAIAEFATGLILTLSRKYHKAHAHIQEHNFSLQGLLGFDLHGKTVGIIGTGKIGEIFAGIMRGFGCKLLAHDPYENEQCKKLGVTYTSLAALYEQSDIISLHCPLTPETKHLINEDSIAQMKPGVILINTGRGALLDTEAVIEGLKSKKIGHLGIDVYEEEEKLFFQDLSDQIIQDDNFSRLQTFPNVIITGHQAFFTEEAMSHIAETTVKNIQEFAAGDVLTNEVN